MPETLDTGSFTGISKVWVLPFKAADIWAGNLGNYVFQGGMKVFPGQTFFTSFELMQSTNSYPDTLRKNTEIMHNLGVIKCTFASMHF